MAVAQRGVDIIVLSLLRPAVIAFDVFSFGEAYFALTRGQPFECIFALMVGSIFLIPALVSLLALTKKH